MLLIPVLSTIPNLLKELVRALPTVHFHEVIDPKSDVHFRDSEIMICDFDLLGPYIYDLHKTKWVQGTWAGIDKLVPFVQKDISINYQITRFSGEHFGKIMSEYVVANIINYERNLFEVKQHQGKNQWIAEGKIRDYRIISDLTVGILGLGSIGNRIGQTLSFLGAKILAVGRKSALPCSTDYSYVSEYFTKKTLPAFLKGCDYIINVLPKTSETNDLLEEDILNNCEEKQSILINIGRSNIISEDSLIKALNNRWLSAAIIDVFDEEPLPETSRLWQQKGVFITPHVAGTSRAKDIAEQFQKNFEAYINDQPLPAIVDFSKGY